MVFSNLFFIFVFLPLNLLCYRAAKTLQAKNTVMLVFSLIFYAWGEPVYVFLLVGMAFLDWIISLYIALAPQGSRRAKLGVAAMCAVNLGLLAVFKYGAFLLGNLRIITGWPDVIPQIALPIGISFYTFQLMSYVIDVYRGDVPPQKKFHTLLLYVSMFHQCIAGPIVRYKDVEAQLMSRRASEADIARGVYRFTFGLAKKALLANSCGALADTLLGSADVAVTAEGIALLAGRPAAALWIGMLAYSLQIYLDFSAYSDMAIGMGLMIGMRYKENFDYPYVSRSVGEFWRRWHISLGSFFRDYVYIPLGGNRRGKARMFFNMFVVWALTGLWHGASWNFVLWGLYFFAFLVVERLWLDKHLEKHPALAHVYLPLAVYFGWILFRFRSMSQVGAVLAGMFGLGGNGFWDFETGAAVSSYVGILIISVIAVTPAAKLIGAILKRFAKKGRVQRVIYDTARVCTPVLLLLASTASLVGDSYNPFLYFQF